MSRPPGRGKDQRSWNTGDWPGQGRAERRRQRKPLTPQARATRKRFPAPVAPTRCTSTRAVICLPIRVRQERPSPKEPNPCFAEGRWLTRTEQNREQQPNQRFHSLRRNAQIKDEASGDRERQVWHGQIQSVRATQKDRRKE